MFSDHVPGEQHRPRGPRALLLGIAVLAVISAVGGTYLGLRGSNSNKSVSDVSASKSLTPTTTTPAPSIVTTPATTSSPTTTPATTSSPTTTPATAAAPTTTTPKKKQTFSDTSKPIAVTGGSFVVVSGKVSLTHIVVHGDTLYGIAQWYKLMGGVTALYEWNHSTVGSDPNLIFPGEVLTITVPGADIPKISPVYLAETTQAS